jgi:hypothetical protein
MSAVARLPRSRGDRLHDVEHSQDEEGRPDDGSYLVFVERCTFCDWLRDPVCQLLAPALQSCLSELSRAGHVRLLVFAGSLLPVPGATGLHTHVVLLGEPTGTRTRRTSHPLDPAPLGVASSKPAAPQNLPCHDSLES